METGNLLNYKRAVVTFIVAYIAIEVLAFLLTYLIAVIMHVDLSGSTADIHNRAYVASERFYPLLNLFIWNFFAWVYFRRRSHMISALKEALQLGVLWLILALLCDIIFFILIRTPFSLSFHDFYVGQIPWIYIIYFVILISPLLYTYLFQSRPTGKRSPGNL